MRNADADEASDIANDAMYLEAIREDLVKKLTQSEEVRVKQVIG
ncbi:hypothetical protein NIES4071_20320 [Calothrix sp. NIES-4071]|nr:hypothetical protein NIES4071_20320 [Calothrix sp. NIES-4071]BAZ56364.1 hypothetical protein NIES4105_20270 [Calothrix sp. NIES-4105]